MDITTISGVAQQIQPLAHPATAGKPQPVKGSGQGRAAPRTSPLGDGDGDHGIEPPGGDSGQLVNVRG